MSIETNKIMNLADGKVLYDDLRGRVDAKYTKPVSGIPASDLADGVFDEIVAVQDTEPASEETRIWFPETPPQPVQVPSYSEFQALESTTNGKADKVSSATNGNFAGLDSNGNLTDSGKKASDFVAAGNFYATEMPMSSEDETTVAEKCSSLKNEINSKQDAPETAGTAGQVLGLDANLKPEWKTVSGGGTVDSSLSTSSENPVQNKVITGVLNDVTESFPNDAYTRGAYDAGWEQGAIGTDGTEFSNSKRIRSDYLPIGEEILGSFQTGAGQEYWLRLYNGSKQFIGSGKVNSSGKITGTESAPAAVSYSLDLDSALETIPNVKYARLVVKYPDNAAITPEDCKFDTTGKRGTFSGYSLEAIYKRKKKADYSSSDMMFYYDVGNGYYTRGFLKLPSNYTTSDRPVPLVVFVHGSADVTSINATSMTANYNTYYNYIRDNGYAVFDCYAYSSKYPRAGVNTWGIPINNDCYEAGIRYVCEKYNIDIDNVFVSCKSQGGTQAFSMLMNPFMPIKAVGMLAPELWWLQMKLGYNANDRHTIATELGFSEDTGHVMDFTNGTDPVPEGFYDYITANMDKWCGYCANFAGLPITNANKPTYYTHPTSYQTGSMSRIGLNRPLKIWIASDDDAVSYDVCDAVVTSLQNGGQIAQLRTMPANTGKHHAVDNDPNALQTTNVTTPLGVTYATIPTAYYELVKFFNQYLTK